MKMDDTRNDAITIESSPHLDDPNQSNQETVVNTMNKMKKKSMQPTPLEYSCWVTNWPAIRWYAFGVFTALVITVAVLTVYFTLSKRPNKECKLTFIRSTEHASVYDSHPRQVVVGDFNKDKHLDLIVANSGADCVGIFMGYGNGKFTTQITYSTGPGSRPHSVAVGHFNNETELDIVVANYGINSVGVLLGDGNGSFTEPIITSLGSSHPLSIAVEDFNNDKQLDIAVVNYGTLTVAVLIGTNDGSFQIDTIYQMGYDSIPYSIATADVYHEHIMSFMLNNIEHSGKILQI